VFLLFFFVIKVIFSKIFAYFKKKHYLCHLILEKQN